MGRYREALDLHERALSLVPENPATHSNVGFLHCYLFNWPEAISAFHKALSLKREDAFTTAMLRIALESMVIADSSDVNQSTTNLMGAFENVDLNKLRFGFRERGIGYLNSTEQILFAEVKILQ